MSMTNDQGAKMARSKEHYEEILKKIKPFLPPREDKVQTTREVWRRGSDLPPEPNGRFRVESY